MISPEKLEKCFSEWMKSTVKLEDMVIISVDGKTISFDVKIRLLLNLKLFLKSSF